MLYLTGQLLLFLLLSAFLGFLIGWFTRGALSEALRAAPQVYADVQRIPLTKALPDAGPIQDGEEGRPRHRPRS